jgi:hypothetical protein
MLGTIEKTSKRTIDIYALGINLLRKRILLRCS